MPDAPPALPPAPLAARLSEALATRDLLFIAADEGRASAAAAILQAFAPQARVAYLPASDALPGEDAPASPANIGARTAALRALRLAAAEGTRAALDLYRSSYRPSPEYPEPRTFLTVNAVVAETEEEARRRALPNVQQMIALRTGAPLHPQRLVEDAEVVEMTPDQRAVGHAMSGRWIVGSPDQAREQLEKLAAEHDVDEVMVHPVSGAARGTDVGTSPNRETTLRLLAA